MFAIDNKQFLCKRRDALSLSSPLIVLIGEGKTIWSLVAFTNNSILVYTVSKNDTDVACYNLIHKPISLIFGRDIAE